MRGDTVESNRTQRTAMASASKSSLNEVRTNEAEGIQTRSRLSRRQLIALFLLFNLFAWLLILWIALG
jgi:hypothetical protein